MGVDFAPEVFEDIVGHFQKTSTTSDRTRRPVQSLIRCGLRREFSRDVGRSEMMASSVSATEKMRAPRGISPAFQGRADSRFR